jgi:hypothetical protein
MAFPLPADPEYRKEVVMLWLDDVEDRLKVYSVSDAEKSWKIAQCIYLSLPPGGGSDEIESALVRARVKLDKLTESKT